MSNMNSITNMNGINNMNNTNGINNMNNVGNMNNMNNNNNNNNNNGNNNCSNNNDNNPKSNKTHPLNDDDSMMQNPAKKMKTISSPNNNIFISVTGQKNNTNNNTNNHYLNSETTLVSSSSSLLSDNIASVPINEQDSAATLASLSISTRGNFMNQNKPVATDDFNAASPLQGIPSNISNFDSPNHSINNSQNQQQNNNNNNNNNTNNKNNNSSFQPLQNIQPQSLFNPTGNSKLSSNYQFPLQFSNPELMKLVYGLCERVGKLEDEIKSLKVNEKSN